MNSSNSREDKDFPDSLERFPSNSDGDQDMLWENHAEKKGKEQGFKDANLKKTRAKLSKQPPWLQNIDMTPELSFRYQIATADMSEVLQRDLDKLRIMGPVR